MNIAYYINDRDYTDKIDILKKYYTNQNQINNFFISCNTAKRKIVSRETAFVNSYYISFMKGKVVFDNVSDYLDNKDKLAAEFVFFTTPEELKNIDKTQISNIQEILLLQNDKIERVAYEQL